MNDDDVAQDEAEAGTLAALQVEQVGDVVRELRGRAVYATLATEHAAERARNAARVSQFVDYLLHVGVNGMNGLVAHRKTTV